MSNPSIKEITQRLILMGGRFGLSVDIGVSPMKIGPDSYMFYATQLTEECRKKGTCLYKRFYVLTGGDNYVIMNENKEVLFES